MFYASENNYASPSRSDESDVATVNCKGSSACLGSSNSTWSCANIGRYVLITVNNARILDPGTYR